MARLWWIQSKNSAATSEKFVEENQMRGIAFGAISAIKAGALEKLARKFIGSPVWLKWKWWKKQSIWSETCSSTSLEFRREFLIRKGKQDKGRLNKI